MNRLLFCLRYWCDSLIVFLFVGGIALAQNSATFPSGGGGTPCTTTATSVQYNNSGAFGCTTPITFASSTGLLQFGGTTSSFTGLQKGSTHALADSRLSVRLADDSDWGYYATGGLELYNGSTRIGILFDASSQMTFGATASNHIVFDTYTYGGGSVIDLKGQQYTYFSAAPTVGACGSSPAINSGSTDTAGEVTVGSAATGCTITFALPYSPGAPFCTVTSQGGIVFSYAISTTAITVTAIGTLSSTKLNYACVGHS